MAAPHMWRGRVVIKLLPPHTGYRLCVSQCAQASNVQKRNLLNLLHARGHLVERLTGGTVTVPYTAGVCRPTYLRRTCANMTVGAHSCQRCSLISVYGDRSCMGPIPIACVKKVPLHGTHLADS